MSKTEFKPENSSMKKFIYIVLGLIVFLAFVILILAAAILGVVVNRLDSKSTTPSESISLVNQIKIDDLMKHLQQLQVFADRSNGTRAIATSGFNETLKYITDQLTDKTNLIVQHQYFTVKNYIIRGTPELRARINGQDVNYTYLTDFAQIVFSTSASFSDFVPVVYIQNFGCRDEDWTRISVAGSVAVAGRGDCTYAEKSVLAEKYQVRGLLVHNDGIAPDRMGPIQIARNNLDATIPAFFISYALGMQLANPTGNPSVMMNIVLEDAHGVGNICADTPTGDKTKTIVIGSHSDSVPAGSGINDNGSGTVGNLVLALNLARLFQTLSSEYSPYEYRVRFCWWGAEELGLIGAYHHIAQASLSNTTTVGERVSDYLLNLNYDMLAGPNYRFGIHDSSTVPSGTPDQALHGTRLITDLFRQWFNEQKLPWSNASLGGGSDYIPFLAAGVAVGGVNTGAGGVKPASERDQYSAMLGTGNGGLALATYDPCYHLYCDRITNINPFAYEKVVKAAAYAIETLGRMKDLETWLYPTGRSRSSTPFTKIQMDKFQNEPDMI